MPTSRSAIVVVATVRLGMVVSDDYCSRGVGLLSGYSGGGGCRGT